MDTMHESHDAQLLPRLAEGDAVLARFAEHCLECKVRRPLKCDWIGCCGCADESAMTTDIPACTNAGERLHSYHCCSSPALEQGCRKGLRQLWLFPGAATVRQYTLCTLLQP